MVSEPERGEDSKTSPFLGREIGRYDVQTVNFRASKKAPSIAAIEPSEKREFGSFTSFIAFTCYVDCRAL
jgi:hypothetical protein